MEKRLTGNATANASRETRLRGAAGRSGKIALSPSCIVVIESVSEAKDNETASAMAAATPQPDAPEMI
jgi:hypothetical protein